MKTDELNGCQKIVWSLFVIGCLLIVNVYLILLFFLGASIAIGGLYALPHYPLLSLGCLYLGYVLVNHSIKTIIKMWSLD